MNLSLLYPIIPSSLSGLWDETQLLTSLFPRSTKTTNYHFGVRERERKKESARKTKNFFNKMSLSSHQSSSQSCVSCRGIIQFDINYRTMVSLLRPNYLSVSKPSVVSFSLAFIYTLPTSSAIKLGGSHIFPK